MESACQEASAHLEKQAQFQTPNARIWASWERTLECCCEFCGLVCRVWKFRRAKVREEPYKTLGMEFSSAGLTFPEWLWNEQIFVMECK